MAEASSALPPLEWVRVFEAAARTGSFTSAARELGLTQAAVSQRIRNLEGRLGARLFERQARGVNLTTEGEAWLPHVQSSLSVLMHGTAELFAAPRRKITIAASASVLELWVAPRLARLSRRLPHLQISLVTIHRQTELPVTGADLEIRFGDGHWSDRRARRLFREDLAPVVSPQLLSQGTVSWEDLPRIATSGPRIGWRDWALAAGSKPPPPPVMRFDTFVLALRAAEAGAGVLLGSMALCSASIENGSMMRLPAQSVGMEGGYWITWRRDAADYAERQTLVEALIAR